MSFKILITDPLSDMGIEFLEKSGLEVIYKPNVEKTEIDECLEYIDGWIIRSGTKISKENILDAKKLQIIGRAGVGTDNIDIESATQSGVVVMNVPDGNTISAAEHTIAMMLSLSRNIQLGHMSLVQGAWNRHKLVGNELRDKILGVVGLGKIGREVIKRALSFDMKIVGYDPYVTQDSFDESEVKVISLNELIKTSDYITLHVPINDATRNLFNLEQMKQMKKTSKIINVARGGIINENDLTLALNDNIISGAALDVYENEPLDKDSGLLNAKNILLTPHLGASTFEAKEGVSLGVCKQIVEFFCNDKLLNALNIPVSDPSIMKKMLPYYKLSEKIGLILSQLSSTAVKEVEVVCYGNASDSKSISLVVLKSILSGMIDQRVNMVNADIVAKERNIKFSHTYNNKEVKFLSLVKCIVKTENEILQISGSVFDENHLRIVNVMGFDIDLNPSGAMLFVVNKDMPGVIGNIGSLLGDYNINIAEYLLGRIDNDAVAYGIVKLDSRVDKNILDSILQLDEVLSAKQVLVDEFR